MNLTGILNESSESALYLILIFLSIYSIKAVVFIIPTTVLQITAGIVFPPAIAIIVSYIGVFCETSIGYYVGKKLGKKRILTLVEKNNKAKDFIVVNQGNSTFFCLLARLLPLPIDLISMFFGATEVNYIMYVLFSMVGMSPYMIARILMGDAVTKPFSKEFLIPLVFNLTLTFLALILFRKMKKDEPPEAETMNSDI